MDLRVDVHADVVWLEQSLLVVICAAWVHFGFLSVGFPAKMYD